VIATRIWTAVTVVAALVAAWFGAGAVRDAAVRPAAAPVPLLSDDDGGRPMFTVRDLAPGQILLRCTRLRYSGEDPARVALAARVDGPLAGRIGLTVERGTGGGFGRCAGFAGTVVYSGTLSGLREHVDDMPWRARPRDEATYRFTVVAPADLPQRPMAAGAEFAWEARPAGTAPPDAEPDRPRSAPGAPTAQGGGRQTVQAGATPGRAATRDAGGRRSRRTRGAAGGERPVREDPSREGAARGGAATTAVGERPDKATDERSALRRALDVATRVAGEAAQRAAFPLLLLLLIAGFLIAQHRIDRKDPKLALAPVHRELDLAFEPFRSRGDTP
jgi:hypothetical protein